MHVFENIHGNVWSGSPYQSIGYCQHTHVLEDSGFWVDARNEDVPLSAEHETHPGVYDYILSKFDECVLSGRSEGHQIGGRACSMPLVHVQLLGLLLAIHWFDEAHLLNA